MIRLASCTTLEGDVVDVDLDSDQGLIAAVTASGTTPPPDRDAVHRLDGYLILPAPAEPHAHLDKALVGNLVVNASGDLAGAVVSWLAHRPTLTVEDIFERSRRAALLCLTAGATAVRTHVDVGTDIGMRAIEALVATREELSELIDLQVVALIGSPLSGAAGAANRELLRRAIDAGVDLVGGAPHIEDDVGTATDVCVAAALDAGVGLDLHTDETLDAGKLGLLDLIDTIERRGFSGPVAASHCVSLGVQSIEEQVRIAKLVAEAGIAVISNPQTNLYLQGRQHRVSTPRGLAALRALLDAGAVVAAGGDNVRDPFNPIGRGDPLEAAALLVVAAHLSVTEAWSAVSEGSRRAMGLPAVTVEAGRPAELLAIRAETLADAIASVTEERIVVHRGRIAARTTVVHEIAPVGSLPVVATIR